MDIEDQHIGRKLREIRNWRRLSLTAVAGLSGISIGHLSRIERGERPVTKRATLEALAQSLRVSPTELTGQPSAPVDPLSRWVCGWCVGSAAPVRAGGAVR